MYKIHVMLCRSSQCSKRVGMDLVQIKVLFEFFPQKILKYKVRFENHVSVMGPSPLA